MCFNVRFKIVKIRAPWPRSFLHAQNLGGPLGPKICCLWIGTYCMQKKRLGNTVPMQQTTSWSEVVGPRYPQILAAPNKTVRFVLIFGGYLGATNSNQLIVCCVGTVLPSLFFIYIFNKPQFENKNLVAAKIYCT